MKDDLRYNALHNEQDSHSESSTDVEESDVERASQPQPPPKRHQRRRRGIWSRLKPYRWTIDTTLLLTILILLTQRQRSAPTPKTPQQKGHRYEFAGDITGFAPPFPQQITTFTPNETFAPANLADFWSAQTQDAWLSIVPKGLGYLTISDPTHYTNLPHPLHDYPNTTVFTTSMTHQLHCLHTILSAYNTLAVFADPTRIDMPWHINHCFEYLRQAIMCAADVALEGAATTFPLDEQGRDQGGSDGWDARHVCKDYGEVYRYLEREAVPGAEKWIE